MRVEWRVPVCTQTVAGDDSVQWLRPEECVPPAVRTVVVEVDDAATGAATGAGAGSTSTVLPLEVREPVASSANFPL